jgi:hypothetical protein
MLNAVEGIDGQHAIGDDGVCALIVNMTHGVHLLGMPATHATRIPPLLHPPYFLVFKEQTLRLPLLPVLPPYLALGHGLQLHLPQ